MTNGLRESSVLAIDDALRIATAIPVEYSRRTWESKQAARKQAAQVADELIAAGQAAEDDRRNIEVAFGCQFHFGNSVNVLGFTVQELASFAGVSEEIASRFLGRMSQTFGHRNPDFRQTFTDALCGSNSYNTLNERPIVAHGGRYWVLVPPVLRSALMTTFYFDLIRDKKYRPTFDKDRAAFLEAQTGEYLRRVFPTKDSVVLNPLYQTMKNSPTCSCCTTARYSSCNVSQRSSRTLQTSAGISISFATTYRRA